VIYLWPKSDSMTGMHKNFGVLTTGQKYTFPHGIKEGRKYAVDNNAFSAGFDPKKFFHHLEKLKPYRDQCLFIACPDVVGDAKLTLELYDLWSDKIRDYGSVAFVAQDGQEDLPFPDDFDWLFIGGTTEWKMDHRAKSCIKRAKEMGKPVHVGRVNSLGRFRYFQKLGVDSVDGTNPIYEPDVARRRWTNAVSQLPFRELISHRNSSS